MKHIGNRMKFEDFKAGVILFLTVNQDWKTTPEINDFLQSMGLDVARGTCLQWLKEMKENGTLQIRTIKRGCLQWHISSIPGENMGYVPMDGKRAKS